MASLHTYYRPKMWGDVVGQAAQVASLRKSLDSGRAQVFLLSGPSGVGKTTLARLAAKHVGVAPSAIFEIDGALNSGVDDARNIGELLNAQMLGQDKRAFVLDECHRLTANAWDALLKPIEEPPQGLYIFLCTTAPNKLPKTILTRCVKLPLKEVSVKDLRDLADDVNTEEKLELEPNLLKMAVQYADGSPRQLLTNMEALAGAGSNADAAEVLEEANLNADGVIDLCRHLVNDKPDWEKCAKYVSALKAAGQQPESLRIVVSNFVAAALISAKGGTRVVHLLNVLDAFSKPYNTSDGFAPLLLSIGQCTYK